MDTDLLILAYERGNVAGNLDLNDEIAARPDVWEVTARAVLAYFYFGKYEAHPSDEMLDAMLDAFRDGYNIVYS